MEINKMEAIENLVDNIDVKEESKNIEENKEPKVKEPKVKEPTVKEPKVKEPKVKEPKVKEPKVKEKRVKEPKEKAFFVYLLQADSGATYVGATVDLDHRLRQHNKEIKGGAHATSAKVAVGEVWTRVCHVRGFPDWPAALQFEWRWKQISRKYPQRMNPLERRILALRDLIHLDRATTKAIPYSEWTNEKKGPDVVQEIHSSIFLILEHIS